MKKILIWMGATLTGFGLISLIVFGISQIHITYVEPKTICVKSHDVSGMQYGYGMGFDGKFKMGWHFETHTVCDKEAPNPKYTGQP